MLLKNKKMNKILEKQAKKTRIERNTKKWRKVANAVLFTIYLKRYNMLCIENRRK